jgi:hypothetical protein
LATYNFIRDPYPDPKLQLGKKREFKRDRTGPEATPAPVTSTEFDRWGLEFAAPERPLGYAPGGAH